MMRLLGVLLLLFQGMSVVRAGVSGPAAAAGGGGAIMPGDSGLSNCRTRVRVLPEGSLVPLRILTAFWASAWLS